MSIIFMKSRICCKTNIIIIIIVTIDGYADAQIINNISQWSCLCRKSKLSDKIMMNSVYC